MIVISGNSHPILAKQIAGKLRCDCIIANTKKFSDQELKIQINNNLYGDDVIILQSTTKPANDHLMELLLLADTAKRANCNSITAVIPYFGYSRQDRPSYEYGPISARLVARLLEISGIDRVITLDLHSRQSEGFFKIEVKNLDPTDLFMNVLEKSNYDIVVSPDSGGLLKAQILASKLGTDLAIMNKIRDFNGKCTIFDVIGNITEKNCIIIDDIVDTGGTLCEALKMLIQNGAHSVSACITHAVFSENCISRIRKARFNKLFVTDTLYHRKLPSFIKVIETSEMIVKLLLGCNK
ncbi:ribose-phosphate diphosphokinase [Holospora curviuscula]|uniref:ribose-phosphate diphosphokinase n=1 Tax=Holospora curviuscula TaxID=1082868 RepID=A0A2S5RI11_9PROT|nr:ribose-phosphate diphosphokinase [Holospora curviuscula]PPE06961.1 Ribose-phosphate pyrophosphokinase [Holospora curviuscula]